MAYFNLVKAFLQLLKAAYIEWRDDKAQRLGAALAYYTLFSIAPLLIIITAVAAMVFGEAVSRGEIMHQLESAVGEKGAQAIQTVMLNAAKPKSSITATIIGATMLIVGAAALFIQLRDAMNAIWNVTPKPVKSLWQFILNYVLSFMMVIGVGFMLILSIAVSTALSIMGNFFNDLLPGGATLWHLVNGLVSLGILVVLFALIFKVIPDVRIAWKDVWAGAALTAVLFTIGKFGLSLYLGRSSVSSTYGAAGSLVVVLVWIYYSAQILFFGAEFTQVYANTYGSKLRPNHNAVNQPGFN